jgi:hypothetical protein
MIRAEQIISMGSCYSDDRVRQLVGNGVTIREIRDADIPSADRLWVLLRLMDHQARVRLAAASVERALMEDGSAGAASWDAVRIARLVVLGEARPAAVVEAERAALAERATAAAWAVWAAGAEGRTAGAWTAAQAAARASEPAWDLILDDAIRLLEETVGECDPLSTRSCQF